MYYTRSEEVLTGYVANDVADVQVDQAEYEEGKSVCDACAKALRTCQVWSCGHCVFSECVADVIHGNTP